MDFTLDVWKEKAAGQLRRVGAWLEQRKRQDVPYLVYGALCGMSLWPLVEAARGGQVLPVMQGEDLGWGNTRWLVLPIVYFPIRGAPSVAQGEDLA